MWQSVYILWTQERQKKSRSRSCFKQSFTSSLLCSHFIKCFSFSLFFFKCDVIWCRIFFNFLLSYCVLSLPLHICFSLSGYRSERNKNRVYCGDIHNFRLVYKIYMYIYIYKRKSSDHICDRSIGKSGIEWDTRRLNIVRPCFYFIFMPLLLRRHCVPNRVLASVWNERKEYFKYFEIVNIFDNNNNK